MNRSSASFGLLLVLAVGAPALAQGPRFTDVSEASGVDLVLRSGASPSRHILEVNGGGVALFDHDRDGDLDLFLANGATLQNPEQGGGSRLYENDGKGKFADVTARVGIDVTRWAMGVAVGDYDGDGDDDLYLTCFGPNVLLRNDISHNGKFVDVTATSGVGDSGWGTSAAFGDLDGDGDEDLYVVNYLNFDPEAPPSRAGRMFMGVEVMAGPSGLTAQADRLFENRGGGKFKEVSAEWGAVAESPGYGLGVRFIDSNADGRREIFVGNDSTENFLFRRDAKGKWKNVGVTSGVASNYDGGNQATMGIAVADVDGNGFPDLFTTNFSSDTNTLHLNLEGRWFDDRTSQFGLAMLSRPYLGWGAGFYDFDADGDEDLFVANGHVYPETATRKMDSEYEQPPLMFVREGRRFRRAITAGDVFETRFRGRAAAFGDLDGDADVDIVMTTLNGRVRLLRNDGVAGKMLALRLRSKSGSESGNGVRVERYVGDRVERRWLGGGSFQSVDAPEAYFATLPEAPVSRLEIYWQDGTRQTISPAPRSGRFRIDQDGKKAVALD